jgi:uncharacterized protein (DUF1778 family)
MTSKKAGMKEGTPRPDRYSDKTDGKLRQTLRLNPEQNILLRNAAEADGLSINTWAVRILVRVARRQLAALPQPSPTPRKRVKKIG